MPEVRLVELSERQTVADAIRSVREAVLPEDIARDELAVWVMSHDASLHEREHPADFPREPREHDSESSGVYLFAVAASSLFQQKIPLYFAAMFHIGRVWTVSSTALREIERLERGEMERFVSELSDRIRPPKVPSSRIGRSPRALLQRSIAIACEEARGLHMSRITTARDWWRAWRQEVEALRVQHERLMRYYNEVAFGRPGRGAFRGFKSVVLETLALSWRPSPLMGELEQDGVRFKNSLQGLEPRPFGLDPGWIGLLLAGVSDDEPHFWHHFMHDWVRVQVERNDIDRKRLFATKVETALQILRTRYGSDDPFAAFDFGSGPASERLYSLCREHKLPDGSDSPWLQLWRARLPDRPYGTGARSGSRTHAEDLARIADAQIKRETCVERADDPIHTSWAEIIQSSFERDIAVLAYHSVKPKEGERPITPEQFAEVVSAVTDRLNGFGYALATPNVARLQKLFTRIQKGEHIFAGW